MKLIKVFAGEVFLGPNFVIKRKSIRESRKEQEILRLLNGLPYFPALYADWRDSKDVYLVMPKYEKLENGLKIGIHSLLLQMLSALETISELGISHNNIHLDHFMWDPVRETVVLIDWNVSQIKGVPSDTDLKSLLGVLRAVADGIHCIRPQIRRALGSLPRFLDFLACFNRNVDLERARALVVNFVTVRSFIEGRPAFHITRATYLRDIVAIGGRIVNR